MSLRRLLLVLGFVIVCFTAARRVDAADVDVEGSAHGGTASGGWACGPSTSVKYGGVGGEIRVHTDFAPEPVAPEPVAPEPVAPEPVAPEPVAKAEPEESDDTTYAPTGYFIGGGGLAEYREYKLL